MPLAEVEPEAMMIVLRQAKQDIYVWEETVIILKDISRVCTVCLAAEKL